MAYVFEEKDLVQLIAEIKANSQLNDDTLLSLAKINSSGIIDIESPEYKNQKCSNCDKYVDDSDDHKEYLPSHYRDNWYWNCPIIPTCPKCNEYVNDSKEHCKFAGDLTYSSSWECP